MAGLSDVAGLDAVPEDALVATVRDRGEPNERTTALKELLRRGSSDLRSLLSEIATDGSSLPELRTVAAVGLGRDATPMNEDALIVALESEDPPVIVAVASSLARIGGRAAFDALARVRSEERYGVAARVAFARTLISYRLGLGEARLEVPTDDAIARIDPAEAREIRVDTVDSERFLAAHDALRLELPAVDISDRGSIQFFCGTEQLWLVLAEGIVGDGALARLADKDQVAAVLFKGSSCPEGWFVHEYILTHPTTPASAAVFGVRVTGDVVHFGEVTFAEARVDVRSVDAPGVPALEFHAVLGDPNEVLVVGSAAVSPPEAGRGAPLVPRS